MDEKIPVVNAQMLVDAGLNVFGLQLFVESVAGRADSKTFKPLTFIYKGVRVTLQPEGEVDTSHRMGCDVTIGVKRTPGGGHGEK